MTIRYVGIGGNNGNDGLSWANRKATLTGAEDTPVAAGDTIYVGPGVYREMLTVDVSGTAGNPITYIGDVTGEHTDGIGGVVRITGSDNDQSATRTSCVTTAGNARNYRSWVALAFDMTTNNDLVRDDTNGTNWVIDRCYFADCPIDRKCLNLGGGCANTAISNCVFISHAQSVAAIDINNSTTVNNTGITVSNCLFLHGNAGINSTRVGGITISNCTFCSRSGVVIATALAAGQTITVNNCIFTGGNKALSGTATGEIVENYNTFYGNVTDRTNTSTGANSVTYPPLFMLPLFGTGIRFPQELYALSEWSQVRALAGTGMAATDIYGVSRPATDSKKSWGAVQYVEPRRDTATKRTGAASLKLADAGRHQVFVPTSNASTVFSCYVYWGADYAGTKPQMVIKQPGQSDTTVTATGSAGNWELLTTTLTPVASPSYCVVELVSNNTAAAGAGTATYFDDLTVV